jgi:hypothetical protein
MRMARILKAAVVLLGMLVVSTWSFSSSTALVPAKDAAPRARAGEGQFFFPCPFSHRAMDDPIVFPGQPGASHMHDFVGNESTDADSTADSLAKASTTCREPKDKSAYWFPSLIRNGNEVTPYKALVYYRNPGTHVTPQLLPFALEIVQGDKTATSPQPNWENREFWMCGTTGGKHYAKPPDCPSTTLMMQVRFPQCWDGVHLDSADHKSHMAYLQNGVCPAGQPILLPQVQLHVQWNIHDGASGDKLSLASGSIYSMHADFFNAWDKDRLKELILSCIGAGDSCHL